MSRLDSRQLDELVQATVELQNRPREERRMRAVAFTAQVDERELAGLDAETRVEIIESRWQHLNHQMATYIAQNLSANQYQLLRAVRSQGRNPIYGQGVVTLTLTLEVGQVTERPFVNVPVSPEDGINTNSPPPNFRNWTGSYTSLNNEQIRAAIGHARQLTASNRQAFEAVRSADGDVVAWRRSVDETAVDTTPPALKPAPVPHKRHILIDRKDKQ